VHHVLDVIAAPVAVIAGIIITASMVRGLDPFLKWTLAVIAGGGAAGLVHTATAVTRGASTAMTGGVANPIFATIELGSSFLTSVLAVIAPLVTIVFLALILLLVAMKILPKFQKRTMQIPPG
jgi:Domain of unknown function (DUF4126)